MKPDLKNEPLSPDEFLKLPEKLVKGEVWDVVRIGVLHREYSGWDMSISTIFPDDNVKLMGYLGRNTGIRLSVECGNILEGR